MLSPPMQPGTAPPMHKGGGSTLPSLLTSIRTQTSCSLTRSNFSVKRRTASSPPVRTSSTMGDTCEQTAMFRASRWLSSGRRLLGTYRFEDEWTIWVGE